jgi:hypothetical protein
MGWAGASGVDQASVEPQASMLELNIEEEVVAVMGGRDVVGLGG